MSEDLWVTITTHDGRRLEGAEVVEAVVTPAGLRLVVVVAEGVETLPAGSVVTVEEA